MGNGQVAELRDKIRHLEFSILEKEIKIDRYTQLLASKSFTGVNEELLRRYIVRMNNSKIELQKILEVYKEIE